MKKEGESFLDYRRRLIDPISKSFCAAKWYNATIWLGNGRTASCHHPAPHHIPLDEVKRSCTAIHNTEHKKRQREMMLKGERPPECEYCWKVEDIRRDNISDRVFKTVIYEDGDVEKASKMSVGADVGLKTLEVAFDRTCNFACSYCNPTFSTTWGRDIKDNGPYVLDYEGRQNYEQDGAWATPFQDVEENPYIKAFWEWWPELSKTLQEMRITGGEPLLSPHVWKFFDFFQKNKHGHDMLFSINSNLGSKDELIEKLIEKSHLVPRFDIYTSCEATGAHAEYIRDGLDYERYVANVRKILSRGNLRAMHFMMTVNVLCLYSLTDFMDLLLELKSEFGPSYGYWSVNILSHPSFMSPLMLPDELRQERHDHLKNWFESRQTHPMFHDFERDSVQRLIDYLDVVKTPHRSAMGRENLERNFKAFYGQYDLRRRKNFEATFPKPLVDWYRSIAVNP